MAENNDDEFLKRTFVTGTLGFLDVSRKRELWRKIAADANGFLSIGHDAGNALEFLKIELIHNDIKIEITESDTRPLKFEMNFQSLKDYNLIISQEDTIEKILKKLGKREIELGFPDFDSRYLVQSKDQSNTIDLLTEEIAGVILKYNLYSLSYSTDKKNHRSRLISVVSRVVDDEKTVEELILLHKRLIDKLGKLEIINNKC
jgi:hypothetical protein